MGSRPQCTRDLREVCQPHSRNQPLTNGAAQFRGKKGAPRVGLEAIALALDLHVPYRVTRWEFNNDGDFTLFEWKCELRLCGNVRAVVWAMLC
jgi:hypothetical protein